MVPLIMNGVLLVLGLLMLREFRTAMLSIRALRWRLTEGTLENWSAHSGTKANSPASALSYSYVVEGEEYRSGQVGYGYPPDAIELIARNELKAVMAQAPEVVVYYDPRKPDVSVLMNGFKVFHALRMLLIVLFFLTVWIALWLAVS